MGPITCWWPSRSPTSHCCNIDGAVSTTPWSFIGDPFPSTIETWHPEAAYVLGRIGWILVRQDRAVEGVEYLERALRLKEAFPGSPIDLAEMQFWLARGLELTGDDPGRMMRLARAARDGLAELGERAPDALAEMEAWIRQREAAP